MELVHIYLIFYDKITISTNFLAYFCFFFQIFPFWIWIHILNADPYPGEKMNSDSCSSGFTALVRSCLLTFMFHLVLYALSGVAC